MADEKLNTGPEAQKTEEAPAPAVADPAHSAVVNKNWTRDFKFRT